jgi:multiple antibiotic resistance protein
MTIYSAAILLFLVMDPLGNVPVFLTTLKDVQADRVKKIIAREMLVALAVLLLFLFFGRFIIDALHISEPALSMAGGIILFLIALRMIFPGPKVCDASEFDREPFIVPLAIPFVAGPSAMATVLLLVSREPSKMFHWLVAVVMAWAVTALILICSSYLSKALGRRGLIATERLMGMILTTIAVQMFLDGLKRFMEW